VAGIPYVKRANRVDGKDKDRMVKTTHENVSRSYTREENLTASSELCNQYKD
jgi:hypothetical protein